MTDDSLRVVVPPALRVFLHTRRARTEADRTGEVAVRAVDGTASLGHVVQSLGVPLTEIEELRLDGAPVAVGSRAPHAGLLELIERRRPQPAPARPERFILDVHLGALARRMRLLGLDVAYSTEAGDDDLLARSLAEHRILLTRDRGLLRRREARWAAYVRGQRVGEQLADVLGRFAPAVRPWTRCLVCNGKLVPADLADVADQLQPGTLRTYSEFARCPDCGRAYWRGAHARRLEAAVAASEALAPRT